MALRREAGLSALEVRGFVGLLVQDRGQSLASDPASDFIRVDHERAHPPIIAGFRRTLKLSPSRGGLSLTGVPPWDSVDGVSDAKRRNLSVLEPLNLLDIPEDGLEFDEALPEAWLDEQLCQDRGLEFTVQAAGQAKVEIRALGPVDQRPPIRIRGRLDAPLRTSCVRCLDPVAVALRADVDFTLFAATSPEADQDADGTYEGESVPVPELLREGLALELPMTPVCEDEPACDARTQVMLDAVNKPGEEAMAQEPEIDPRWEKLAALKKKL